ncbi:MAG: hypothetical protein ACYS9T_12415 [Planctomycetota bacterium]
MKGFSDRLLHLCPVNNGWAVVGRTDKYLSPAAVETVSASQNELKLRLVESGPFAIWSAAGVPSAKDVRFEDQGNGLWKAHLDPGHRDMLITVTRQDADP